MTHLGLILAGNANWIAGHVYVQNLLAALEAVPHERQPRLTLLASQRIPQWMRNELERHDRRLVRYAFTHEAMMPRRIVAGGIALSRALAPVSLAHVARRCGADVLFPVSGRMPANAVPWIGWIPDFQPFHMPENWSSGQRDAWRDRIARVAREAPHLVLSSRDAGKDLEAIIGPRSGVTVLPFTMVPQNTWFARDPAAVARQYGLPERFALFPSQFWRHKDHLTLFEAVRRVRAAGVGDLTLVCTGLAEDIRDPKHGPRLLDFIATNGLEDAVRVLGVVPRADLTALMRRAAVIVQPSRFEGWSALVEEARSLGKPLLVSNIAVHREQNPPDATFFPVGDAEALAMALGDLWPATAAGPDPEREARAHAEALIRARAFADRFLGLISEVAGRAEP